MLKAFDYTERKRNIKTNERNLSAQEKRIAMKYVTAHPMKAKNSACPMCGRDHGKYIFERWDIDYLYCKQCGSIYVPVDKETEKDYLSMEEWIEFHNSDNYQTQEEKFRGTTWDEIVFWLTYRTFRYLGRNKGLSVIDIGNKYMGLSKRIESSPLCEAYELRDSSLPLKYSGSSKDGSKSFKVEKADVVLYLNQMKHEVEPKSRLNEIREYIKDDGILVLSTRLGSGFDVLTLKGGTESIFPYEHVTLPSRRGLETLLEKCGFEVLEITTPGTQDVDAVFSNRERIESDNYFVKYLIESADERTKSDFQQFLQKSCLSSFAQVIARKA